MKMMKTSKLPKMPGARGNSLFKGNVKDSRFQKSAMKKGHLTKEGGKHGMKNTSYRGRSADKSFGEDKNER